MNLFTDPLSAWRLPYRWLYPADWCADSFHERLELLRRHPEWRGDGNLLTDRAGKRVWRIDFPPTESGTCSVACKLCDGRKPWRYIFDLSLPAREWRNYQALHRLGLPAPEVLAYGETRRGWKLLRSFIITRFIEGTRDGRDFMPEGRLRDRIDLRRRFCELAAPHIATLHRNGFFHKALHVRNLLYRGETPEEMEVFFIDVARSRIRCRGRMKHAALFDLYTPLRDLQLPAEESRAFLRAYLAAYPDSPFDAAELERRLRAFRRHGKTFDVIGV